MFWIKNLIIFNSLIIICDRMLNHSDFLQFWETFNLMRILTNLLKFCVLYEICVFFINLLTVFLCLLKSFTVCHCYEQFINTWKFVVLNWVKINFVIKTALFFLTKNWLKTFWKRFSQIVSFFDSFWKKFLQNVLFCIVIETADNWLKNVWKKLSQMFLFNFTNIVEVSAYLHDLIE